MTLFLISTEFLLAMTLATFSVGAKLEKLTAEKITILTWCMAGFLALNLTTNMIQLTAYAFEVRSINLAPSIVPENRTRTHRHDHNNGLCHHVRRTNCLVPPNLALAQSNQQEASNSCHHQQTRHNHSDMRCALLHPPNHRSFDRGSPSLPIFTAIHIHRTSCAHRLDTSIHKQP